MNTEIRTDLALEEQERFAGTKREISGVVLEKKTGYGGRFGVSKVVIKNECGARAMRKPMGTYVTMEDCLIEEYEDDFYEEMSYEVGLQLGEMLKTLERRQGIKIRKILAVGLGNRDATPDALGPETVGRLFATDRLSAVTPDVTVKTGIETADYIRGLVKEIHADGVIAIDSLAARNTARLNTTIQIADTGICPGSGVGNHRMGINEETMGVPVIAIGVPTVVEAAAMVKEVMEHFLQLMEEAKTGNGIAQMYQEFTVKEKHQFACELMEMSDREFFVTPKDIDENIRILGKILAEGIEMAVE